MDPVREPDGEEYLFFGDESTIGEFAVADVGEETIGRWEWGISLAKDVTLVSVINWVHVAPMIQVTVAVSSQLSSLLATEAKEAFFLN